MLLIKKNLEASQKIGKLRDAELVLGQATNIGEAIRKLGIQEQTYYRWRKEYGGLRVYQARRLLCQREMWPVCS